MAKFESGLFTNDDFLQIENVLYSPKEEELAHRQIFSLNTSYARYAEEIGYDYYEKNGSAKIIAKGGNANDLPFVGEKGGRVTQKCYTIASGVSYTKAELEAVQAKRALGKGPAIQIDTLRISSARRFIMEQEAKIAIVGNAEYGIAGILDSSFYGTDLGTKENVALGAVGTGDAAKRLWSNKTAAEILTDLETAVNTVEANGIFKARTLVLGPSQYNRLRKPISATVPTMTLLSWIKSEGMYFERIIISRMLNLTNNGDTVNYFMVLDNMPEVAELALLYDIELGDPQYDLLGGTKMAVSLKTGGVICRHPSALYVGKGI